MLLLMNAISPRRRRALPGLAFLDAGMAKQAVSELPGVMEQSLLILGSDLRVQSANRHFFEHFSLTPRATLGRRLRELADGQWSEPALAARLRDIQSRGTRMRNFELQARFPRLGQRLLRLGGVRVPNSGRPAHALFLTMRDITELRRSETAAKVEEIDRIQREFIAHLSHELRTPVTVIKGYAQTLKSGGFEDLKHRDGFVDTIERNADRLTSLIEDLMRISQLAEHPGPRLRAVALAAFAKKRVSDLAPICRATAVSVRIKISPALAVAADPGQLAMIFGHLIGNSLKYSRSGGKVLVRAAAAGTDAVVSVEDNGIGIAAKDLPRVFDRFYRARAAKSRPGAGLGLSIVRQIVLAHGGRVWAESRRGKGTAIRFTIPLASRRR